MFTTKKVTACISGALAFGFSGTALSAIPAPGAFGEAYMNFANFKFSLGDTAAGTTGASLCTMDPTTSGGLCRADGTRTLTIIGAESAKVTVDLNGFVTSNQSPPTLGGDFSATQTINVGFTPGALIVADPLPVAQFAGGKSSSEGNSLLGSASVLIHGQAQLGSASATGGSNANQILNSEFTLSLTGPASQAFELAFDAAAYTRAALGQILVKATATTDFFVEIQNSAGTTLSKWFPGLGELGIGSDFSTALGTLQRSSFFNTTGDSSNGGTTLEHYELEVTLAPGDYKFIVNGSSIVDLATPSLVPEPGSLALLGIGLLGLGVGVRRGIRNHSA
jgi:hypothetical protein